MWDGKWRLPYLRVRKFVLDVTDRSCWWRAPVEVVPLDEEPDDLYYDPPPMLPWVRTLPMKYELRCASLRERMKRRIWIARGRAAQDALEREHPEKARELRERNEELLRFEAAGSNAYQVGDCWAFRNRNILE
jgi:hypothetical protein